MAKLSPAFLLPARPQTPCSVRPQTFFCAGGISTTNTTKVGVGRGRGVGVGLHVGPGEMAAAFGALILPVPHFQRGWGGCAAKCPQLLGRTRKQAGQTLVCQYESHCTPFLDLVSLIFCNLLFIN